MATTSRASDTPVAKVASDVAARLRDEPFCFEFFQAVRLLERLRPERVPVGGFGRPAEEVVHFRAHPTLSFPASEIQSLEEGKDGQPSMSVNFMGLTGAIGTLPLYYTELIMGRIMARDRTLQDFFDIFHHRIISLFYKAWQKYHYQFRLEGGDYDAFSHYLLDLVGLGTPGLQERQAMADDSLLYYSGLLAQQPRSATALRLLLSDYFQAPVEIEQFVGAWYRLDQNAQCRLEQGPLDSRQLGLGAVVGDEIWEPQARVRVVIGPLPLSRYLDFLPAGTAFEPLRAMTRLFSGDEIDFELQLILDREETPHCELGSEGDGAPQLGYVSWAKSKPIDRDPADTILELS
ncbi:MAG TPA: type VI secretion system baseplate subunit TssG [Bryobacteraceae bacterium]|jgi:type VI secretion system protein ImpH|nr:type VI secretion system baseplate subunit TssG [Bryobacteraceae bacterium]